MKQLSILLRVYRETTADVNLPTGVMNEETKGECNELDIFSLVANKGQRSR